MKINQAFLLMGAAIVMAASAVAAPTCVSVLGADVTTLNGGGGCTVGNLTFSNFQVNLAGGSGTPIINLSGVYNPSAGPEPPAGEVGLNFNPNLGNGSLVTDIHFNFTVSGTTLGIFLYNGGTSSTAIQERVCTLGESTSGACTGVDIADLLANGGTSAGPVGYTGGGQNQVFVWKDINIANVST